MLVFTVKTSCLAADDPGVIIVREEDGKAAEVTDCCILCHPDFMEDVSDNVVHVENRS